MSAEVDDEFSEIRGALGSIGLSALVVFGGSLLSQAMGFGTRIVMARFLSINGYGDIVLGITVLNILGIVSIIGLGQAQVRYLPQSENQEERKRIAASIYQVGIVLSFAWVAVGFFGAEFIAGTIFGNPGMVNVVRIFALALPFYVFYKLSLKGIQGHKETIPNILTRNLIHPLTRLMAVVVLAVAGFGAIGLAIGYNLAFAVGGLAAFFFFVRNSQFQIRSLLTVSDRDRYRELLTFSVPLAISASFNLVTKNSDRFLLGVFDTSSAVGIYDVTFLLSQFIMFFGPVLNYLTQPIMAEYDSIDEYQRMDQLYTIITRWLVVLTFPLFVLLILFPETMLETFFGAEYRSGAISLVILSGGYFISRFFGLGGNFLTATGETKVVMYISVATASLNLGLNITLIPVYGILGAALATALSLILNNVLQIGYIYSSIGIHPFTPELIIPSTLAFICLIAVGSFLPNHDIGIFGALATAASLGLVFVVCILLTRSVYMVELKLADSLLTKVGLNMRLQDRLKRLTIDQR